MRSSVNTIIVIIVFTLSKVSFVKAQKISNVSDYLYVNTYVNPVLPGDHPDSTLLQMFRDIMMYL
jgi:xylan 1,4-beta-xylosidase